MEIIGLMITSTMMTRLKHIRPQLQHFILFRSSRSRLLYSLAMIHVVQVVYQYLQKPFLYDLFAPGIKDLCGPS
jgi:hypothetical protein